MDKRENSITVLTCCGKDKKAAKMFIQNENNSIEKIAFQSGMYFEHEERAVSGLQDIADLVDELSTNPRKLLIRGQIKPDMKSVVKRRINGSEAAFTPMARPYVMLDIDAFPCPKFYDAINKPKELVEWVLASLPSPFLNADCFYKFSSSQGVSIEEDAEPTVSLHLWFCLDRVVSDEEWKRYFKSVSSPVDPMMFNPVQMHYTANPMFKNMEDPLPKRSGLHKGKNKVVTVPEIPRVENKSKATNVKVEPIVSKDDRNKALDILSKYYKTGSRHYFCGAIAATLYRGGWYPENAAEFVFELAENCSDEEADSRYKSALNICDSVDNGFPAQGIPTLKNKFQIVKLDEALELLGLSPPDVEDAVSKLTNKSSLSEIREVVGSLMPLSEANQNLYLDRIRGNTDGYTITSLRSLLKEMSEESKSFTSRDWGDITVRLFLDRHNEGQHFLRSPDKRYWRYNRSHWELIADDLVKRGVIECAREISSENLLKRDLSGLVNSALNILEGEACKENDPFGLVNKNPPIVINCENGELWFDDKSNAILKPHRPGNYFRHCLDVDYDPTATSPKFDKAVLEIFSNSSNPDAMYRHFMELGGYICQPSRKQAIFVLLYGRGSNGKSSLMKLITKVLGSKMVMASPINEIQKDKFKLGALDGKLLLYEDDMKSNARLDDGFLKTVSEETPLRGEQKYKDSYDFISRVVPIMASNEYPFISDLTEGLRRRMMVIPFNRQFTKEESNKELFDSLWQEEASGILNQLIAGFVRLQKRGFFEEPMDCVAAKNKWLSRSNILPLFIDEMCEIETGYKHSLTDLYAVFVSYCERTGAKPIPRQQWLASRLEQLGIEISKSDGGTMVVRGIRPLSSASGIKAINL